MRKLPFFGKVILPNREKKLIQKILSKHRLEPVSEDLKNKIYKELMEAKQKGLLTIPFKVVLRNDPSKVHRPHIEIVLDTKV